MKKNVKRINESQLRAIVAESVKKVLNESAPWANYVSPYEEWRKEIFHIYRALENELNLDPTRRSTGRERKLTDAVNHLKAAEKILLYPEPNGDDIQFFDYSKLGGNSNDESDGDYYREMKNAENEFQGL